MQPVLTHQRIFPTIWPHTHHAGKEEITGGTCIMIRFVSQATSMHTEALRPKKWLNIIFWWEVENIFFFFLPPLASHSSCLLFSPLIIPLLSQTYKLFSLSSISSPCPVLMRMGSERTAMWYLVADQCQTTADPPLHIMTSFVISSLVSSISQFSFHHFALEMIPPTLKWLESFQSVTVSVMLPKALVLPSLINWHFWDLKFSSHLFMYLCISCWSTPPFFSAGQESAWC